MSFKDVLPLDSTLFQSAYKVKVARGVGDFDYGLNPRPKLVEHRLPQDSKALAGSYLVQGCASLFSRASSKQIGQYIQRRVADGAAPPQIALELVHASIKAGPPDNKSVMIVPLGNVLPGQG